MPRKQPEVTYTFRLPSALKAQAEEAAQFLDVTISQVLRKALRLLVQEAARDRHEFSGPLPTGLVAAGRAIPEVVKKRPENPAIKHAETVAARLSELEKLELRNELNRVTRKELQSLRQELRRITVA